MPARGRKPQLDGAHADELGGESQAPDIQPAGGPIALEAPDHLPEVARKWWEAKAPIANRIGIVRDADVEVFEYAALMYARARKSDAVVDAEGLTFVHPKTGAPTKRPEAVESRACWKEFRIACESLGLSPAGRARGAGSDPAAQPRPAQSGDGKDDDFILQRRA